MIRLYLSSGEELRAEIEREREMVVRERMERYGVEVAANEPKFPADARVRA